MATLVRNVLLHGSDEPLQELRTVRAGRLSAVLDGVDLRYVRLGEVELVRRIYVAVRDRNWNTIPGVCSEFELDAREDSFTARFTVRHTSADVDFTWEGEISGSEDGRIAFGMDGRAQRELLYNRIGFCVLHPWRECAGRPFRGMTPDGPVSGGLPRLVGPQRFENGVYVPLFPSVSRLEVDVTGELAAVCEFEGDLFETEDQRNWTDASFKTYCTPLALGFPHRLGTGDRKTQTVTVYAQGEAPAGDASPHTLRLEIGAPTGTRVPDIGLALAADAPAPSATECRQLHGLSPAHVRFDLHVGDPAGLDGLARAITTAGELGARLELALFLRPSDPLDAVRDLLASAPIARVLVAPEGAQTTTEEETTPAELVELVRDRLGLGTVPVAGGTDMYFCELNRTRPRVEAMDGVFWSMNAQVHAFDDASVLETPEAQGEQVRTARDFAPGKALFVGPVSLRRRYNVNATVAEDESSDTLPDSVDPRQASLLGAAWTLASAKHLAEPGATAITYFETVGWRGVIQGDGDPPRPGEFPARAGQAFPLAHVLADVGELQGWELLKTDCSRPLTAAGLAARGPNGELTLLVANLTPAVQHLRLAGVAGDGHVRRLNEDTAQLAMFESERFRSTEAQSEPIGELTLAPYETVRIDTHA